MARIWEYHQKRHMREVWVMAHGALWGLIGTFGTCRKCSGEQGIRMDPPEQLSRAGIYSAA